MSFQQALDKIEPKKLFLIDSLGGLLSAIMLGFVLVRFENTFGMPHQVLYILARLAFIFFIYSLLCFLSKMRNWRPYLKFIAICNLMYCGLTIGLVIYLYQELTILGLLYFVIEILVITFLAIIELRTASDWIYKKPESHLAS